MGFIALVRACACCEASILRCLQIMPVASRLDWITRQIFSGRGYHVGVGAALDASKFKVKITLHPERVGAITRCHVRRRCNDGPVT